MRKIIFGFVLLIGLLTACTSPEDAKPVNATLWEISKDGNSIFLTGSVHLLRPQDLPIPAAFDYAYKNSSVLVLETNVDRMEDPDIVEYINETYLTAEPVEFIIVGMAHVYGPDGLLTQLRNRGYTIKQLVN